MIRAQIDIGMIMVATLVGGIVARAARGREMIAPIPLGLVLGGLGGAASFRVGGKRGTARISGGGHGFSLIRWQSLLAEQSCEPVDQPRQISRSMRNLQGINLLDHRARRSRSRTAALAPSPDERPKLAQIA
jgi:hypothetical protein